MLRTSSAAIKSPSLRAVHPGTEVRAVVDALRRVVRELRLTAREAEREAGVSGAQLFVLQSLAEHSASSLNDLAERTLTDQSSVSVVVKRLVDQRLVRRTTSPVDARRVELELTAAGRRLLSRCPEPTQLRLVDAVRRLEAAELARLTRGLTALVREMGLCDTPPQMFFEGEGPRARVRSARRDPQAARSSRATPRRQALRA